MLIRNKYLNQIKTLISKEKLLVILWARQAGKTSLLLMLQDDLDVKKHYQTITYFNFEDIFWKKEFVNKSDFYDFIHINTGADLKDPNTLIMLDEVQEVQNIQWILKSFYDDKTFKAKLIATGSGIWQLSSTWSSLVGRWWEITVYPFSFMEFIEAKGLTSIKGMPSSPSLQAQFYALWQEFTTWWGYPAVVFASSQADKLSELNKIITRLIEKDIAFWLTRQEFPAFEKVLQYLVRNICNTLKYETISQEIGISKKNIESYISFLKKSQILHFVYPFFTDKTKELTTHPKIYLGDNGLVTFITRNFDLAHEGRWIENNVFLELLKNKKYSSDEIKTYKKLNNSEIDFIYQYSTGEILPIEIKSGKETKTPKIFYSFDTEYPQVKKYIKTVWDFFETKELWKTNKDVMFLPNWNIWNVI